MVQSLVSNATEYTPKGGEINISLETDIDTFILKINDTGIGIPQKDQEHIADKFTRGSNAVLVKTNGTGMGLFIAHKAVALLNGKIWFESEENKGTTFYVQLPIKSEPKEGKRKLT